MMMMMMMMMMMRFMLRLITFDHPLHSSRDGEIWCEMVDGLTVFFYDNMSDNIRVICVQTYQRKNFIQKSVGK